MSKKKSAFPKNFLAISLKTGIISAIIMSLSTIIIYLINGSASRPVLIWNHFVLLIVMYFAVKTYRKQLIGYISFKECYISGLFNGIFTSVLFGFFVYINIKYIDKNLINNFISVSESAMNQYISGDELAKQKEILYQFSSPFYMSLKAMGELLLMSIFLPLLMSIFLKKEKQIEDDVNKTINE